MGLLFRFRNHHTVKKIIRHQYIYFMLFPAVLLIFVFQYLPLVGWLMAFKDYKPGFSLWSAEWIGFHQFYVFFFQSSDYIYLIRNTLIMNILSTTVSLFVSLIFALLINEIRVKFFVKTVQTITFFPFFISWVIIYSLMNALFAQESGLINQLLVSWHVIDEGINLLGGKQYAWGMIVAMDVWKGLGYNSIIFIASISAIPVDQYEAAEIDGAGRFKKMRYVTVPNLMPTLIVLLIINSGYVFSSDISKYLLFMNSLNWETMEVLDMYIYNRGLKLFNFPYATAVEIVKSCVSITLIIGVNQLSKKLTGKAIF